MVLMKVATARAPAGVALMEPDARAWPLAPVSAQPDCLIMVY